MTTLILPVATLWWREMVRFARQRSRVLGACVQPLVFWLLLAGGFQASFSPPGLPSGTAYGTYAYPGILAMILLFTVIFATISVVEDRQRGFLQGVLAAPVPRPSIVLGQALGCTTLGVVQGSMLLPLAPSVGIPLSAASAALAIGLMGLVAFGLSSLSLALAWRFESTQGFHAVMNLVLLPMWLLSGAFFPVEGAPRWLRLGMQANPLTYGLAAIRHALCLENPAGAGAVPEFWVSLAAAAIFAGAAFAAAVAMSLRARG
jgi:ABC-2 type transport system permease protein